MQESAQGIFQKKALKRYGREGEKKGQGLIFLLSKMLPRYKRWCRVEQAAAAFYTPAALNPLER
jgi:hypothetical protein